MAESGGAGEGGKTFTQEEVDALIAEQVSERNKAIEAHREKVLDELKEAKRKLQGYDGLDPTEYEELRRFKAEAEKRAAKETGDWDAREEQVRQEMAAAAQKEKKQLVERVQLLQSALEAELVESKAVGAIAEMKGSPKVLLPHVKAHVKVVEKDGVFREMVVDGKGNPRIGDADGNPMSIKQFVTELKQDPDFARNFEGTGSSGGGASKSVAGGGGKTRIAAGDNSAFIENLEGVAKGSVEVGA
jgi:hypothetical protein